MTNYVGVNAVKALLHKTGVQELLLQLVQYLRADFARWDAFQKSARVAAHSDVGVIELMPTTDGTLYGFKYVNGHPVNTAKNLLTVTAFGALADVETGYPLLLAEMTILTALRTAATSALAAQLLARKNATTHALIGCGAQADFQALAMRAALGAKQLRIYDTDRAAMDKLLHNLTPYDLTITACDSVADAVQGADVITTATAAKTRAQILLPDMIGDGVHINGIGGDCPGKTELHIDILRRARCIAVEFEPQSRIEGETQQDVSIPVVELARLVDGRAAGRVADADITVFDSVGFALEDFSVLRLVYDLTREHAQDLDLIPTLDNPKDLFGFTRS